MQSRRWALEQVDIQDPGRDGVEDPLLALNPGLNVGQSRNTGLE